MVSGLFVSHEIINKVPNRVGWMVGVTRVWRLLTAFVLGASCMNNFCF